MKPAHMKLLALIFSSLLAACGGGEDEEQKDTQPVDCKARPEICI